MKASSVKGGNFIKADDIKTSGPQKFHIAEVGIAEFDPKEGKTKKERRLELTFADDRKFTLNSGNTDVLIEAYGDETDEWTGKVVVLYHDPNVKYAGRKVGGVKVKIPSRPAVAQAAVQAQAAEATAPADPFTGQF